ncbi:glycosyltransferase family 39 protein, partial [uncultured Chryseobacterium sp.]
MIKVFEMNVCKNIYIYFFIAFLFFFQVFCSPLNVYDEGIVLVNAKRLLQGETYLKDFWTIYPKGQFWIFESWMKIFGGNLLSVRCLEFLIGISFGSFFYFIVRNLIKSSKTAAFSSLIFCYYLNSKSDFLFFPPIYTALICI